jgi:hypothetical protein
MKRFALTVHPGVSRLRYPPFLAPNRSMKLIRNSWSVRFLERCGLAGLAIFSLAAWWVVWHARLVLSYNDAMSHLNIARRIVDDIQPGLAQIGTVWLPLSHLLYLPFVWNYWAWQSGFAGSLVSMLAYVSATVAVYLTLKALTESRLAAAVGGLVFAVNLNMVYLQSTPLTEPLYVALVAWSLYLLLRFFQTDDARYLIGLGALGFLQVVTRYDGWFVVIVQGLAVLVQQLMISRPWRPALGRTILVMTPAAFGIALWLLWNASFGNPLYFAVGSGSAMQQQSVIAAASGLAAKGNLPLSAWLYLHTVADNVGVWMLALAGLGLGYWILTAETKRSKGIRWLLLVVMLAPLGFNILALYLGFSTISIPELGHLTGRAQWFNVRYGIIMLPVVAVAVGLLVKWGRTLAIPLVMLVSIQTVQTWQAVPITVLDGTRGASAFTDADIAGSLSSKVRPHDHVLMSFSTFSPVSLASGLKLHQFIHEGVQKDWQPALHNPGIYADWVVISNYDTGDPVYNSLVKQHPDSLKQHYHLVFVGQHASLYKLDNGAQAVGGYVPSKLASN